MTAKHDGAGWLVAWAGVLALGSSAAAANHLVYYGGPVISNVKVIAIDWGPSVDAGLQNELAGFYGTVTGGAYFDWLNEYSTVGLNGMDGQPGSNQVIGRGSFGGSYTIMPSISSTTVTNDQIKAELAAQIGAGHLPAPELDAHGNVNSLYVFNFPPGITITLQSSQSCAPGGFCEYHYTTVISGKSVPYAVLPDQSPASPCTGGCGTDSIYLNNANAVMSHLLVEGVTDPDIGLVGGSIDRPGAWYDPANGEIGDICNAQHAVVDGYTVQKQWSNTSAACIASVPNLPICNGSPTRCRPCYASDNGQAGGCTGTTPVCQTDATSAAFGRCVACTDNAQCSGATPTCDGTTNACRSCVSDVDCAGGRCVTSGPDTGTCAPPPSTTTLLPCTTARCIIDAAIHGPACQGDPIPLALSARFDQAVGLLDRTASAKPTKARMLRRKARAVLVRAKKVATHEGRGKHPKLTSACEAAIVGAVTQVVSGLAR